MDFYLAKSDRYPLNFIINDNPSFKRQLEEQAQPGVSRHSDTGDWVICRLCAPCDSQRVATLAFLSNLH